MNFSKILLHHLLLLRLQILSSLLIAHLFLLESRNHGLPLPPLLHYSWIPEQPQQQPQVRHKSLPLGQDDADTIFGDDQDAFEGFHFSPFNVQPESDEDDAPMTTKQLMELNSKLDSLIESSKTPSSDEYSQASVKSFFETLTKEQASDLALTNKVVADSAQTCKETTEKVAILISNAQAFLGNFQTSFQSNIAKVNQVISNHGTSLHTEKDAPALTHYTGFICYFF